MTFDEFIKEGYRELDLQYEEYQDTNVISDFFKSVKHASKGGKPADSPEITLKNINDLKKLEGLTNPKYQQALDTLKTDKTNLQSIIVKNAVQILNANASTGGSLTLNLYELASDAPRAKHGDSKGRTEEIKDPKRFEVLYTTAKTALSPALEAGVLKWKEPRELSPKDLFNRFTNSVVGFVGKTDTGIARM